MNHKNIYVSVLIALGLVSALPIAAEASVLCGVFQGTQCEVPLYYMKLCADITLRQPYCERLCQTQQPICGVEDFAPWVSAYQDIGRRGIRGVLQKHANEFDEFGNLTFMSEKTVRVCHRTPRGEWKPLPFHPPKTCPKAGVASNGSCRAGTVFDAARGVCTVQDSAGSSGVLDYQNLMNQSAMLVATQNQHFSEIPNTDTNLNLNSIQADTNPSGLAEETKIPSVNVDLNQAAASFRSANAGGGSKGSSSSGVEASLATTASNPGEVIEKSPGSGTGVASLTFSGKDGYGAAAGVAAGGSGSGASGTSWFSGGGPGAVAVPGAASDGGAEGGIGFGKAGVPGRGLAATGEGMNVEDPANYFLMSDIGVSLFKRVTAQCRRKEKELVLPTTSGL